MDGLRPGSRAPLQDELRAVRTPVQEVLVDLPGSFFRGAGGSGVGVSLWGEAGDWWLVCRDRLGSACAHPPSRWVTWAVSHFSTKSLGRRKDSSAHQNTLWCKLSMLLLCLSGALSFFSFLPGSFPRVGSTCSVCISGVARGRAGAGAERALRGTQCRVSFLGRR